MIKLYFSNAGLCIFSVAWLAANHYDPWLSFHSETLIFIAISMIFLGVLTGNALHSIPRIAIWFVFATVLPWLLFFIGIGSFAGDALLGWFYLFSLLMAFFVGYCTSKNSSNMAVSGWLGFAHALWIAGVLTAAVGLLQWFMLTKTLGIYAVQIQPGGRASGNLAQANHLATFLLIGMVALVYVFEQKVIGKTGLTMAEGFMTVVLVLTQSRAGMVSVLIIAGFLFWKQRANNLRLSKQAVLWWLAGFALATVSLPSVSEWLLLSESRGLTSTGSINERWLIWKQVVHAIAQAPWLGYGWNQTPTANALGALAFPGSSNYTNAHNIVLDLMVWCGIPLGILLSALMAYWFISRLRLVNQPDAVLAMTALLPIAVHSLLEFPFAYAYFLIPAGIFIGVVEAAHIPSRSVTIKLRWLWPVLGVWACVGSYIVHEYLQIEDDYRVIRLEDLLPGSTPADYKVPQIWMLSHMGAMLSAARQVPKPDMPEADMENLRKVSDRFAYGAIRFKYAQALALNGDPEGASKQMQIIHGMYGDFFYKACKDELLRLTAEKYPQLSAVKLSD